jgi:indole-3-glycerol phosphate synthase
MARPKPFPPEVEAIIPENSSNEKDPIALSHTSLPPESPHAETAFSLTALRKGDYNTPSFSSALRNVYCYLPDGQVTIGGPPQGRRDDLRHLLGMPMSILEQIIGDKVAEVAERRRRRPLIELQRELRDLPPARDFLAALRDGPPGSAIVPRVIAEVKKASPSKGVIRPDFDPVAIAQTYAANGAAALSVLTDERYFQGQLTFLAAISSAIALPLLRKDFIIDLYQVYESRLARADAILLIVAALETGQLHEFMALACELGMAALLEVHTVEELERILPLRPRLLGINNRDLRTFHTDIETTVRLLPLIPPEVVVVSESGIETAADITRLRDKGVRAFLIGESLMRAPDPGVKLRELLHGTGEDLRHHEP